MRGEGEGKKQGSNSENGLDDDQSNERTNKRAKGNDGGDSGERKRNDSQSEMGAPANKGHFLSEDGFLEFLNWKASKVIEVVVDEVLEDAATKVMEEKEGSWEGASVTPDFTGVLSAGTEEEVTPDFTGILSVGTKEEVQAMEVEEV